MRSCFNNSPRRRLQACAVLAACVLATTAAAAAAADAGIGTTTEPLLKGQAVSLDPKNLDAVAAAFVGLLSNPYNMSGMMLPNEFSLARAGLSGDHLGAAADLRAAMRQSLSEVVSKAVDDSAGWVQAARAELEKAGGDSKGTGARLLQRLSSIPVRFDAEGNTLMSNPLTAIGTFMVNAVQQQLKEVRKLGGPELNAQLQQSAAGRKLLQEMQSFEEELEDVAGGGADDAAAVLDLTSEAARAAGPAAVARQLDRMMAFLGSLVDVADDVAAEVERINAAASAKAAPEAKAEGDAEGGDDDGLASSAQRQLQQLPDPNAGYAKAAILIFTNLFDFLRANGLYGLTPLLADLRGILTRYNWIADLLNIIDAPLENFVNANYVPLPQSDEDFIKLVQKFAGDYCKLEKATSSETALGEFEGPTISYEVKPVSCPIYTDPDTGRNYVSFVDCDPAQLVIKTTPLTLTEAYFSLAEYTGTECKYSEPFGTDLTLTLGGGEQSFSFTRSAKGINIVPTVVQFNGRGRFAAFTDPNAEASPSLGNGFFANNFGWSFNGING